MLKIPNNFLKKCSQIVSKFQNKKTPKQKNSLIYVLYYTEIISSLFFWQQLLFQFLEKFLLMFVFLLDTTDTANQFQCSVVLI